MDRRAGKTRTDPWSLLAHWQNLEFINGPAIWDQRDQGTWISSEVEILGTAPGWSLILIRIPRAGVVGKLGSGISETYETQDPETAQYECVAEAVSLVMIRPEASSSKLQAWQDL